MRKLRFSKGQLNRASEILGNLTVAWFSIGIISPLFISPENFVDSIQAFGVSLVMSGICSFWSMYLAKGN